MRRIFKKKTIEGCTEELHRVETKDSLFSVGAEANYDLEGFITYKRRFFPARYRVYICDNTRDKILHTEERYCYSQKEFINHFNSAKKFLADNYGEFLKKVV